MEGKKQLPVNDNLPLHPLEARKESTNTMKIVGILVIAAVLGIGTGYVMSRIAKPAAATTTITSENGASTITKGTVVGSEDTKTFKDTTEGVVKKGGIKGEGEYHLVRPGGDSQNVYMTSSLVDLSLFTDKKVKVWGETNKAQSAGWLMDVGRVEVE